MLKGVQKRLNLQLHCWSCGLMCSIDSSNDWINRRPVFFYPQRVILFCGPGDKALQECNLSTEPSVDCSDCIPPGSGKLPDRVFAFWDASASHGQSEKLIVPSAVRPPFFHGLPTNSATDPFWLIGATDGHAKNFSIFLGRGGRFKLTLVYAVLPAQPSLASRQIERKQLKLAMSVGDSRHYRIDEIKGRHFIQSAERAGLPGSLASEVLKEVAQAAETAINTVEKQLPRSFPKDIHHSVKAGLTARLKNI
ncbi:MAG: HipA domain-containing protein [Verrucomicrobiota bacterium]